MIKKKGESKLELRKRKIKEADEDMDYLRQVDLPAGLGGGSKFVADTIKEEEQQKKSDEAGIENYLEGKGRLTYLSALCDYALQKIYRDNFPEDWNYYVLPTVGQHINIFGRSFKTQEGVLFVIKSPKGNVFTRGVRITMNPEIDVSNMETMIVQVENTIDSEKGILLSDNMDTPATLKKTKSGIYLPN